MGKILPIVVILLFLGVSIIPNVNAKDNEIKDDKSEPLDLGRTIIRGNVLFPIIWGDNIAFFALHCHFTIISDTYRGTLIIRNRLIFLSDPINFYFHPIGPFGIFRYYLFGAFKGGFDPSDCFFPINKQIRTIGGE